MNFYKLEANGNDFIVTIQDNPTLYSILKLCDRNIGIGADGYINIDHKFNVSIFNGDGSKANMCGNGLRCLSKLLNYLTNKDSFIFHLNGFDVLANKVDDEFSLTMPAPMMIKQNEGYLVNLLNTHYIEFCKNINNFYFKEKHIDICNENKCNVHAIEVINKRLIKIKSYEYGVKETKSCGSGAICAFYVCFMLNLIDKEAKIVSSGGEATCKYENGKYLIQGKASLIYKGEYYGL